MKHLLNNRLQDFQKTTGTVIVIEEVGNEGVIQISSDNKEGMDAAILRIKGIITVPEVGEVYEATVKGIQPYGALVEFLPGKQGLLHISEVSWSRLESLDGVLNEGDSIKVKLLDIDKTGKYKLSRKVLLPKPEGMPDQPEHSDRPRREGGDDRGRGPRRDNGPRRDDRPRRDDGPRRDDRPRRDDAPRRDQPQSRPESNSNQNGGDNPAPVKQAPANNDPIPPFGDEFPEAW